VRENIELYQSRIARGKKKDDDVVEPVVEEIKHDPMANFW
jgi:hypothetical protein